MTPPLLTARYPSLAGRSVFITGGATGIGASLVERFFDQGARVGFIDIDEAAGPALAARLADAAKASGGTLHAPSFVRADVTDIAALRHAMSTLRAANGPIRVVLNNAANDQRHQVEQVTEASWDAGIAVNLRHQFFAAQYAIEDMRAAGGGSIVNFGSVSWKLRHPDLVAYASSKAAVNGLTRALARDLGRWNIRVNTLVPGWTMTEKQLRLWVDDKAREDIARNQCIGRPLLPDDIAAMALFLAADDSAMCSAQEFIVDGGWV